MEGPIPNVAKGVVHPVQITRGLALRDRNRGRELASRMQWTARRLCGLAPHMVRRWTVQ